MQRLVSSMKQTENWLQAFSNYVLRKRKKCRWRTTWRQFAPTFLKASWDAGELPAWPRNQAQTGKAGSNDLIKNLRISVSLPIRRYSYRIFSNLLMKSRVLCQLLTWRFDSNKPTKRYWFFKIWFLIFED